MLAARAEPKPFGLSAAAEEAARRWWFARSRAPFSAELLSRFE